MENKEVVDAFNKASNDYDKYRKHYVFHQIIPVEETVNISDHHVKEHIWSHQGSVEDIIKHTAEEACKHTLTSASHDTEGHGDYHEKIRRNACQVMKIKHRRLKHEGCYYKECNYDNSSHQ